MIQNIQVARMVHFWSMELGKREYGIKKLMIVNPVMFAMDIIC